MTTYEKREMLVNYRLAMSHRRGHSVAGYTSRSSREVVTVRKSESSLSWPKVKGITYERVRKTHGPLLTITTVALTLERQEHTGSFRGPA